MWWWQIQREWKPSLCRFIFRCHLWISTQSSRKQIFTSCWTEPWGDSKISLPPGKLCNNEMLHMNENAVDNRTSQYQGDYAKMALTIFYPFRTLDDLKKNHSYWNLFDEQRRIHFHLDKAEHKRVQLKFGPQALTSFKISKIDSHWKRN